MIGYWVLGIGFSKFEVTSLECLKLRKEEFRFELSTPHFTLRTSLLDAGDGNITKQKVRMKLWIMISKILIWRQRAG